MEIGAGYGRTCHTICSNTDVESYYIIDLAPCLKLCRLYLKDVIDFEKYKRIHFISVTDINELENMYFDLCINIDSFAEMDSDVVKFYMKYIDQHCNFFYVKNPVGKYKDPTLSSQDEKEVDLALNTGLLRDIIDIHNNLVVKFQSKKFVTLYRPGNRWQCIADAQSPPWSYYWQALYRKSGCEEKK